MFGYFKIAHSTVPQWTIFITVQDGVISESVSQKDTIHRSPDYCLSTLTHNEVAYDSIALTIWILGKV